LLNNTASEISYDVTVYSENKIEENFQENKQINIFILMIPSFFDMMETSLKNITLVLIATSVTQMLRSSILIITYVLSLIFLRRKAYRHHLTGIFLIIFGIVLGGLS